MGTDSVLGAFSIGFLRVARDTDGAAADASRSVRGWHLGLQIDAMRVLRPCGVRVNLSLKQRPNLRRST